MNPLDLLFGQVAGAVQQHADPNTPGPGYDPHPVLNALSGMFGQYAQQNNQQFSGYQPQQQYQNNGPGFGSMIGGLLGGGGAAGALGALGGLLGGGQQNTNQGGGGGVLDASQDPYGDPADQNDNRESYNPNAGPNVRPASEDPYGDPADQR
ncbi:hypothetical protein IAD21_05114 [Abditibacteriota bacterium]|nr:hypothetical protein IAD21_05114 [Abditibacteriota bacterium]